MSAFFTATLTRALPGLIDSNDTRADATATDMAVDKKRHTRHTDTICSRTRGRVEGKWIFVGRVVERDSRTSCKRISPINCQSNLVTQKMLPLRSSYATRRPPPLPSVCARESSSCVEVSSSPARRVDLSSHLSVRVFPSQSKLPPCSFGNGGVKCKYRRVGSLRTLVPPTPSAEYYARIPRQNTLR